ncbi:GMC oxidoreductase [Granulicella arctica]|uniref:GMC oxidoreductase n=1 Tax=Granulicella arctica TaxID=940613 RepID=UPI0021E03CCF|nr:GMC oxidoreductase [Granulicella arctica]
MPRLSSLIEDIKSHYSVAVIGSGYGGGIAASRLSRAGQQVCVLERGLEFQPGEYPNTVPEVLAQTQVDSPAAFVGSRTGLYDMRVSDDIDVFCGCGLGGTSLVNANVSLPAEPRVFDDTRWPDEFRADVATKLQRGYQLAQEMLTPSPYPDNFPTLPKLQALEKSAGSLNEKFYRPPINVTFKDGLNAAGVPQKACTLCGDCVTGCNYSAKNTVLMNYLPDARNHGAEIYTQVGVRFLEYKEGLWLIHYQFLDSGRELFDAPTQFITADMVVVSAGMLGSTEILLRSKANGLSVSDRVGQHFTGNGDVLAFGYDTNDVIDGVGYGSLPPQGRDPVGPCITGIIDDRLQPNLDDGMVIEEGSIPGALGDLLPAALAAIAPWAGTNLSPGLGGFVEERTRELESLVCGPYHGAVQNTQTYLVMTHDDASGSMTLEDDRLRLHWPGAGTQPVFQRVNDRLDQASKALGGVYVRNPLWSDLTNHNLITVHPLGGCTMSADATTGVVNHKGQVFSATTGTSVYDSLYVCDGSVMPRSLGVNPLLTISAVAERCCALIAEDRGWTIDYNSTQTLQPSSAPVAVGLRFTEAMKGFFSMHVTDDFAKGSEQGEQDNSNFEFILTVIADDLDQLLASPDHPARMVGMATAPALSAKPLTVSKGEFRLLVTDPSQPDSRLMTYAMNLTSEEGKVFVFTGTKIIKNDGILNLWRDSSTLYITISDVSGAVLGKGILVIEPADFMRQMMTMEITNAKDDLERLTSIIRFGKYFAGSLFDVYGGALAPASEFNPQPIPRKKRPLRMCAPEVYHFLTEDHVELRLTRYKGGVKGPVMLSPGYGTSTVAYLIDTVDTNFPEFLYANGYDVWLFDYRASPALPSARTQFSLDDVATKDYPAAVAQVRSVTGAADIQIVAHCVGSMTFLMSMLSGKLQGIRSAVCSQVGFYPTTSPENQLKAIFNVGSFLHDLGIDTVTTDFDPSKWTDILADALLKPNIAGPPCTSAVCRRIWAIYGEVYEHSQLNNATHDAIHEMFGIADITTFNHLLTIIRAGQIVDKDGHDVYLPNIQRLKIPLAFFQAMGNRLFLPEGTERSFELLCAKNGADNYLRLTMPNYEHMDCFIGKNAAQDIFPLLVGQLDGYNLASDTATTAATLHQEPVLS